MIKKNNIETVVWRNGIVICKLVFCNDAPQKILYWRVKFYPISLISYFLSQHKFLYRNVNNCRGQTREFLHFYDTNVTSMTKRYSNREIALWPAKITKTVVPSAPPQKRDCSKLSLNFLMAHIMHSADFLLCTIYLHQHDHYSTL